MGRARRYQPKYLADKLKEIRTRLDLSQTQMAKKLGSAKPTPRRGHIAEFESGKREPSLSVLLQYGKVAGVIVDVLIDDELDLPEHLPATMTN
jgi:transcriptional regulator with XRE-family HTH domain